MTNHMKNTLVTKAASHGIRVDDSDIGVFIPSTCSFLKTDGEALAFIQGINALCNIQGMAKRKAELEAQGVKFPSAPILA